MGYEKYRQDIIIIKQNCEKRDGEDRILITDLRSKIKELEVQLKTCEIERIRTKEYEERWVILKKKCDFHDKRKDERYTKCHEEKEKLRKEKHDCINEREKWIYEYKLYKEN